MEVPCPYRNDPRRVSWRPAAHQARRNSGTLICCYRRIAARFFGQSGRNCAQHKKQRRRSTQLDGAQRVVRESARPVADDPGVDEPRRTESAFPTIGALRAALQEYAAETALIVLLFDGQDHHECVIDDVRLGGPEIEIVVQCETVENLRVEQHTVQRDLKPELARLTKRLQFIESVLTELGCTATVLEHALLRQDPVQLARHIRAVARRT